MENKASKTDFTVKCNWLFDNENLDSILVIQNPNINGSSNGICRNKVFLKAPKETTEALTITVESLNTHLLIESTDFVCSSNCAELYSENGYLSTSRGVHIDSELNFPTKTSIILNHFDPPLISVRIKFPLEKELDLFNIFLTPHFNSHSRAPPFIVPHFSDHSILSSFSPPSKNTQTHNKSYSCNDSNLCGNFEKNTSSHTKTILSLCSDQCKISKPCKNAQLFTNSHPSAKFKECTNTHQSSTFTLCFPQPPCSSHLPNKVSPTTDSSFQSTIQPANPSTQAINPSSHSSAKTPSIHTPSNHSSTPRVINQTLNGDSYHSTNKKKECCCNVESVMNKMEENLKKYLQASMGSLEERLMEKLASIEKLVMEEKGNINS